MKKVLIVAAKANMIMQFNIRNINILQSKGYEVHVACDFNSFGSMDQTERDNLIEYLDQKGVHYHHVSFERGVGSMRANVRVVKQLMSIMDRPEEWEFIHAHSPIGGVLGRIAAKMRGVKSIYTAHGFHFSKGGQLKNWAFFPVEWILNFITDELVVINQSDYQLATRWFKHPNISYMPSVGADIESRLAVSSMERQKNRKEIRAEMDLRNDDYVFLSVGELNKNKNHEMIIRAMPELPENTKLLIAGVGSRMEEYHALINELGLERRVKLLGYRRDLNRVHHAVDSFVFPSLREGLGMSGLDALVDGLYVIGSKSTNMKDYLCDSSLGMLVDVKKINELRDAMQSVHKHKLVPAVNRWTHKLLQFDKKNVDFVMSRVYSNCSD